MKVIVLLLSLVMVNAFAKDFQVDAKSSKVDWHLHLTKDTNVYGEIPLIKGNLDFENQTGQLEFNLKKTKSWELDEGKKDFSDSRDSRIQKITGSKKYTPVFKVKSVEGFDSSKK